MKKPYILIILGCFFILLTAIPSFALSDNAERFLRSCRALDSAFPPENWDRYDLRDAAIEVLDEIESGSYEKWPLDFCLKTLGHTQFPEDVDRILKYEDEMIYSVLRSLKGFPSGKAIECHIRWIDNKVGPKRELAIQGLADIDFRKLKEAKKWHSRVLSELNNARQRETEDWLIVEINDALAAVQSAKLPESK
ncbi:hypothetical protein KKB99_02240 [bacterium]|nr:hypothetical protein [bacterium]MBU1024807.1 hypothetical protein [bacterium]